MRVGELFLALTGCSTLESRFCTSPEQPIRAGPGDEGVGEQTQKHQSRRTGHNFCLGSAGELALVVQMQGACGLTNSATTQVQIQGYESTHPNIHPTHELLEHIKGGRFRISKAVGYPQHRAATGYPRGVPVKTQY
ncbi:hypothetical protein STEG23_033891 [Scotinomys teguina]